LGKDKLCTSYAQTQKNRLLSEPVFVGLEPPLPGAHWGSAPVRCLSNHSPDGLAAALACEQRETGYLWSFEHAAPAAHPLNPNGAE